VGEFDLVVVIRFFDPALLAAIPQLLRPGGTALIETFSEKHRAKTGKPASAGLVLARQVARHWEGMELAGIESTLDTDRFTLLRS
jgi:hypothetical protein